MLAALQQMQLQQMHQNEMMWQMMQGFMNQSYAVQMQGHHQHTALLGAVSSTVQGASSSTQEKEKEKEKEEEGNRSAD
eukprot:8740350-Karenia_brevis.AAC.1